MRVTIHQPEHLPWLGFFHKISDTDTFVILDNVQFRKNYFQNRNKFRTPDGWSWITVSVHRNIDTLIKDVAISADKRWKKKWIDPIYYNYKKTKYFEYYFETIKKEIYKDYDNLAQLNVALIQILCDILKIKTDFVLASKLGADGKGSGLILNICKSLKADCYVSGISGKDYLNIEDFKNENIKVIFQEFHHPIYKQLYEPFLPCMSIIDLLFNYGPDSLDIIKGVGVPIMQDLFL